MSFLLLLLAMFGLCACSGTLDEPQNEAAAVKNSAEKMTNVGETVGNTEALQETLFNTASPDEEFRAELPENCVAVIYVTINPRLALYLDDKNVIIGIGRINEEKAFT